MSYRKQALKYGKSNPPPQRRGLSVPEACEYIGCGVTTLYELIAKGELKSFKLGRSRRLTREACDALIDRKEAEAA